jgi:hypothetical protein
VIDRFVHRNSEERRHGGDLQENSSVHGGEFITT